MVELLPRQKRRVGMDQAGGRERLNRGPESVQAELGLKKNVKI